MPRDGEVLPLFYQGFNGGKPLLRVHHIVPLRVAAASGVELFNHIHVMKNFDGLIAMILQKYEKKRRGFPFCGKK
ncbi:MAG: hypothetical protein K6B13_09675 [Prevotella sp.]|jgi:hypothetical protein|nr:hypothetical protein [Prevotella sp.]